MLRSYLKAARPPAALIAAVLALLFGISASTALVPASAAPAPVKTQSVQIRNFAFAPALLVVARGTTVTWTNSDEDPHTVTAGNKAFHSTALDTDDKYSFTFNTPGEFAYFCSLHPHMTGKIIVRAS
jgi:plastocyanin